MSEFATIIGAIATILTTVGGAAAWLWRRIEKRFKLVDKKLADCEAREARQTAVIGKHLIVIELLWQEVNRRSRGVSPVLDRSKELLNDLKETRK